METRSKLSESFRNDAQLQLYYLNGVVPTDKTLGVGAYGSVVEVKYKQVACAAKCIHKSFLNPGNQEIQETIQKYRQECQLMAGLRHPNITQFLGLCFLEGSELPVMVMEKLEMRVDDLLECAPNIPLPVKLSILTDTCSGLVYLHGRPSPIVHSDLTAGNVLLTSSLTAKIADVGNSCITNSAQLVQTMFKAPGTLVYMPPEVLSDSPGYGPPLDVFSFGHLALYVLTQVLPVIDPRKRGEVIGRSEVKRREDFIKMLERQCTGSHSVLVDLVTNCLHNNPEDRPSADQLLTRLQVLNSEVERTYGGNLMNVTHVLHIKEIKQKDKRIDELKVIRDVLETENRELIFVNAKLKDNNKELETEKSKIIAERCQVERTIVEVKTENDKLKSDNHKLLEEKSQLESHHQQETHSLQMEVERLTIELQRITATPLKTNQKLSFQLQLDWRRGPDMPVAMSEYIQSVEINGTLYVGGGLTNRFEEDFKVMAYNTQSCQWHSLPPYTTKWFAMTTINSKLVLVGGLAEDFSDSSKLGEWEPNSNKWISPFPPMSTPRCWPSATTYKRWVVVAGGYYRVRLHSIEVLDVSNMQWSTRPSTPTPWDKMKSTKLGDTWYLMGGVCGKGFCGDYSLAVHSVSLEALVSQSASDRSNIWKKLRSLDCTHSSPLINGGSLLAVSGREWIGSKKVSTILRYISETDTWVQARLLPHAVRDCTCIMASDKIHVIGGYDKMTNLKNMFTSNSL